MPPVLRSLEQISTGYSIFEKDQVLTHDQLNSVSNYADDQIRLTRVRLSGVGIICGLRVSLSGNSVTVTRGVGVTTDGDLVYLDQDTVYDQFKNYDKTFPAYKPLYVGGDITKDMIPAFEMVAHGVTDSRANPSAQFATLNSGKTLGGMSALLLMESYAKDDSLCSGTDCDNLGAEAVNTLKLILIDKTATGPLRETVATPSQAFASLSELIAERPILKAATTIAEIADAYRSACNSIHTRLIAALVTIYTNCSSFLSDAVSATSATGWTSKLNAAKTTYAATTTGIQYYYDFLTDIVDNFNEFRDALFADTTWCAPPIDGFPKHLLLGDLTPGANLDANRTGFYPSPMTSRVAGELEHAKFLVRRLDSLINHFAVPTGASQDVRITPSAFEDRPLDERAIPFYYTAGGSDPIQKRWSYKLVRRGQDASTYSYNGVSWGTGTAAAKPLAYQIGRFPFFRIEGHIGKAVTSALTDLDNTIKANNLPFSVRAVLLSVPTDTGKVTKKYPGTNITVLHNIHQIIRSDITQRLMEAESFSGVFQNQVVTAVDSGKVPDPGDDYEGVQVRNVAVTKGPEVARNGAKTRSYLSQGYTTYSANTGNYQGAYQAAVQSAADFVYQASPVVKAEFNSPFDSLIGSMQAYWLPWLDQIIAWKGQNEDAKLLFSKFIDEHPQAEHFGGVERGGTFVLVHDTSNAVVADFMLPYRWEEEPIQTTEPVLTTPSFRPHVIIDNPIRIIPSRITLIDNEFTKLKPDLGDIKDWTKNVTDWMTQQTDFFHQEFEDQSKYFQTKFDDHTTAINNELARQDSSFQEKLNWQATIFGQSIDVVKTAGVTMPGNVASGYQDAVLGSYVQETKGLTDKVTTLRDQAAKATTDQMKSFLQRQISETEAALSSSVQNTTQYMTLQNMDVTPGSEAFGAALQISSGMNALASNTSVHTATVSGVTNLLKGTASTSMKMVFGAAMGQ
jgi:hypothetical protein